MQSIKSLHTKNWSSKKIIIWILLFSTVSATCNYAQVSGGGAKKDFESIWLSDCEDKVKDFRKSQQAEPLLDFLPIWGKQLREAGYDLPLPTGVGANFIIMKQTNELSDFSFIIDNTEVPYDLQFYNMQSTDLNVTFRPDVWIFPFLNVYGVFGHTSGSINPVILVPGISADLPNLGEIDIVKPFTINDKVEYRGATIGFGTTLAGGFKSFFFTVDYNYTATKLNVVSETVYAQTISPRVGVTLESYKTIGKGTFWIGAMYLKAKQKITDRVNIRQIDGEVADAIGDEVSYSMTLGIADPWNMLIGGSWSLNSHMNVMLEVGVGDRNQFMVGLEYRF